MLRRPDPGDGGLAGRTFWVPCDYCAAFLTGRPLLADTVLRLPFPTVFACFAHRWTLPPHLRSGDTQDVGDPLGDAGRETGGGGVGDEYPR